MMADCSWIELGKLALTMVTAGAAGYGAWIALKNWRAGEENRKVSLENLRVAGKNAENAVKWKKAELAASYLQPFLDDEEIVFALRCIDWGVGVIPVPEKHRAMLNDAKSIKHDPELLAKAMIPELTTEVASDPKGMLYRLTLDALFTRLEWIGHRVELELIGIEDIRDIRYWAQMLSNWPYAPNGYDGKKVFLHFLERAGYKSTLKLLDKLNSSAG